MSYADCIKAITNAAGETLGEDDVSDLVAEVQRRFKARKVTNPLEDETKALAAITKGIADEAKLARVIEQRSRGINVIRKQQRMNFYDGFENKGDGLSILMVGSEKRGAGFGNSVDAQQHGIESDLVGPMMVELRAAGADKLIAKHNPDVERQIARNMFAITDAEVNGKTAKLEGPQLVQDAARIFSKYQEAARQLQNDAGAWIGKAAGWIVRQAHDPIRITKAGFESWRDYILPRLDPKTFEGIDDQNAYLRHAYNALAEGRHYGSNGEMDWLGGFKGPGNLGKRLSQNRSLHFKSADDWFDYNERFGVQSVTQAVFNGMHGAARNIGLMRTFGTNPRAAFEADMRQLGEAAQNAGDAKTRATLNRQWGAKALREGEFEQISGEANRPGNPSIAGWMAGVRAVQSMANLGGVLLSSFPDIAVKAFTLRRQGIGFLDGFANGFGDLLRGRGAGMEREIADLLGVGYDGMLGHLHQRFSAQDSVPGKMGRLQQAFFRINLLSWWVDGKATGAGLIMSNNLAKNVGKEFAGLDPHLQAALQRYGIGADQWAVLRQAPTKAAGDTEHLTPDAVNVIPNEAFRGLANGTGDRALQRAKDDLRLNLRAFFIDQVNAANTMGGARERSLVSWGTRPGTPLGEAVRFVMQYKMFPTTYVMRHVVGEFNANGAVGIAQLVLVTTALGYLTQLAKDTARGKTPPDVRKVDTWKSAFASGGGLGIYSDFLMAKYTQDHNGGLLALAGPAVGNASDMLSVLGHFRDAAMGGGKKEAAAGGKEFTRLAINNTPGVNLFYTRAALDYLILHNVQDWLSPGSLDRATKKMKEDRGQTYFLPPH